LAAMVEVTVEAGLPEPVGVTEDVEMVKWSVMGHGESRSAYERLHVNWIAHSDRPS
jgi:hypothetical protein